MCYFELSLTYRQNSEIEILTIRATYFDSMQSATNFSKFYVQTYSHDDAAEQSMEYFRLLLALKEDY